MTRKHFNAIAAALRDAKPPTPQGQLGFVDAARLEQWERCVSDVTHAIDTVCPLFNRARFYRAAKGED